MSNVLGNHDTNSNKENQRLRHQRRNKAIKYMKSSTKKSIWLEIKAEQSNNKSHNNYYVFFLDACIQERMFDKVIYN